MIRHQYSYWLDIRDTVPLPKQAVPLAHVMIPRLEEAGVTGPDGSLVVALKADDPSSLHLEVDPEAGTVEEDTSLLDKLDKLAAQWPSLQFEFLEQDEEDKSVSAWTLWRDGKRVRRNLSRTVPADEDYDEQTLDDVLGFLFPNLSQAARNAVKADYRQHALQDLSSPR